MNNESYYISNSIYTNMLENQNKDAFKKIVRKIIQYTNKEASILDAGCGTGVIMKLLVDRPFIEGIDISNTSIKVASDKGLSCKIYNGTIFPYSSEKFDLVYSCNVLEHVNDPITFLNEQYRVLKYSGYLILVCPNFLSITNNYHWHTKGFLRKIQNFLTLFCKMFYKNYYFDKMHTVTRVDFHPDDDACNIINPLDIIKWANSKNLALKYWSSQQSQNPSKIQSLLDIPLFKIFLGSCFFVFQKKV